MKVLKEAMKEARIISIIVLLVMYGFGAPSGAIVVIAMWALILT